MNFGPLEYAAYLHRSGRTACLAPACVRQLHATWPLRDEVRVRVRRGTQPLVLVLSSNQPVAWHIEPEPGARLEAVLLAGAAGCTVRGAADAPVSSLGGACTFRPGSMEFRRLEHEVMRCTRRAIRDFLGKTGEEEFEVDAC